MKQAGPGARGSRAELRGQTQSEGGDPCPRLPPATCFPSVREGQRGPAPVPLHHPSLGDHLLSQTGHPSLRASRLTLRTRGGRTARPTRFRQDGHRADLFDLFRVVRTAGGRGLVVVHGVTSVGQKKTGDPLRQGRRIAGLVGPGRLAASRPFLRDGVRNRQRRASGGVATGEGFSGVESVQVHGCEVDRAGEGGGSEKMEKNRGAGKSSS